MDKGIAELQPNFIDQILLLDRHTDHKVVLQLAVPSCVSDHKLTVISGRNNTGKTHILMQLNNLFGPTARQEKRKYLGSEGVSAVLTDPNSRELNLHYLRTAPFRETQFSQIDILDSNRDQAARSVRQGLIMFIRKQFNYAFANKFEEGNWSLENETLREVLNSMKLVRKKSGDSKPVEHYPLYPCDPDDPTVKIFERYAGGLLYFKRRPGSELGTIELFLDYGPRQRFKYERWSDGQKDLFTSICVIEGLEPSVLLIDEIENHYHPEFMTALLEVIKAKVSQAIVVSHHPHLIFSHLVDKLLFLECTDRELPERKKIIVHSRETAHRFPRRVCTDLNTDLFRVMKTYGLFHSQDRLLLDLADSMRIASEQKLIGALIESFSDLAHKRPASSFPDGQTQQLLKQIESLSSVDGEEPIRILDYGAGKGEAYLSFLGHEHGWSQEKPIEWICWEPNHLYRKDLHMIVSTRKNARIKVINSLDELHGMEFCLIILKNVVHHLNASDLFGTLQLAAKQLRPSVGSLLILEMFPLVSAERLAVPYEEGVLANFFIELGWQVDRGRLAVKTGTVTTYWVSARPQPTSAIDSDTLLHHCIALQESTLTQMCKQYLNSSHPQSLESYIIYMQLLNAIAALSCWKLEIRLPLQQKMASS